MRRFGLCASLFALSLAAESSLSSHPPPRAVSSGALRRDVSPKPRSGEGGQSAPTKSGQIVTTNATAVLVDVVVRDKRGQPVKDLTSDDFEVREDGTVQTIASLTPMFEPEAARPTRARASDPVSMLVPAAPSQPPGPSVTAIVFDRLRAEPRRRAAQAVRSYLGSKEESADFVGVFGIDLSMEPFVPFTRNALALRKALDAMAQTASTGFSSRESQGAVAEATREAGGRTAGNAGRPDAGSGSAAAQLAGIEERMMSRFAAMELDQQGYATTDGLLAIVEVLARIPGRKSIVLFSEGIAIPPAVHRFYLGVIDAANRANVSIYTMDAAGLRAESTQAAIRDGVNMQAGLGISTSYSAEVAGSNPLTQNLEGNEGRLRSDPAFGLDGLARSTGGLFFNNTNNLAPAFERIASDQRHYYLLAYTPSNTNYDGRFRAIDVKTKRESLTVAARRGYFAVRDSGGIAINAWDAPALAALDQRPLGNAFPVRLGTMLFPERGRPGLVPLVVDLKTAPLTFRPTADGKSYASDFTVLVRFLDDRNKTVRRVSQHYDIRGPIDQIHRATEGDVIFYRESELPPGVYTAEAIVYDAPSGKSTVRLSTVDVPRHSEGALRMSSLVTIKRTEKLDPKQRSASHPLVVGDLLLQPNLGDPIRKAEREVGFYFTIYPASGSPPRSRIELVSNGGLLAQMPMTLSATDPSGRIQQVGRLPIADLVPGTYELRAIVQQGSQQIGRSARLQIID